VPFPNRVHPLLPHFREDNKITIFGLEMFTMADNWAETKDKGNFWKMC